MNGNLALPSRRLSRPARQWLARFLDAQLAGSPVEATVWRVQHAKSIVYQQELERRRMIEADNYTHYVVTLLGLMTASGAPAKRALSQCERLFKVLRRHYAKDPKHPLGLAAAAQQSRLPETKVMQVAKFLERSPAYLSIHPDPENPSLFPTKQYVTLKNFAHLQEQARTLADLAPPTPLPWISPSLDGAATVETRAPSVPRQTEGHCPKCGPDRDASICGQHVERWEERSVSGSETYNILKCGGLWRDLLPKGE